MNNQCEYCERWYLEQVTIKLDHTRYPKINDIYRDKFICQDRCMIMAMKPYDPKPSLRGNDIQSIITDET